MRCAVCNELERCPQDCEDIELEKSVGMTCAGERMVFVHITCEHMNVCKKLEEADDVDGR